MSRAPARNDALHALMPIGRRRLRGPHVVVALACALLAACVGQSPRPVEAEVSESLEVLPIAEAPIVVPQELAPEAATAEPVEAFWDQFRARLTLPNCDAHPRVEHWVRRFNNGPGSFARLIAGMLPKMQYVFELTQQYALPAEFVLLPIVESHYRPVRARATRLPSGMWQMAAATARAHGARIEAGYDARLDLDAASHAALDHVRSLGERFNGDWRLAIMAYNAGPYAVSKALRREGGSVDDLSRLRMRGVTYEHYHRLLALACLIANPERHGIELPEPGPGLRSLRIEGLRSRAALARHLGVEEATLADLNAGFPGRNLGFREGSTEILIPDLPGVDSRLDLAAIEVEPELDPPAPFLGEYRVRAGDSLWSIARRHAIPLSELQSLNPGLGSTLRPGQRLNVPSTPAMTQTPVAVTEPGSATATTPRTDTEQSSRWHVVRTGDSLWRIARENGTSVEQLARLNALDPRKGLRPGQRLRLGSEQETQGVGTATESH